MPGLLYQQVYDVVRQIPYGKVLSYGAIARLLGRPRAARIVGQAMRLCEQPLPCHRVLRADGTVAGGMFAAARAEMLRSEGVPFLPDGRVDIARCAWRASAANVLSESKAE